MKRLPDGRLLVPVRAESKDPQTGETIIGDGAKIIGPDDPDYEKCDRMMKAMEGKPSNGS